MSRSAWLAAACLAAVPAACQDSSRVHEIRDAREVPLASDEVRWNVASDERLRLTRPTMPAAGAQQAASSPVEWDVPEGWTAVAPTQMRVANFVIGSDKRTECYLTLLGGDGGGMGANINRWRKQMSLPALSPGELDALEKIDMLGSQGAFVDFSGTWTGMSGTERGDGYRLAGVIVSSSAGAAFLKMVGPDAVVGAEIEHLKAFAKSLRATGGH